MPDPHEQLAEIWRWIYFADSLEVPQRAEGLEAAIADLRRLIAAGYLPAWYPLGYAYYCHPNRRNPGSQERIETVNALQTAVSHGVEVSLANLYLAHHYYDLAEYATADIYAQQVGELNPIIRTKHWELLLCIQLRLHGIACSRAAVEEYARRIESTGEWEPEPINLFRTLADCLKNEGRSPKAADCLERLDEAFPEFGKKSVRFMALMPCYWDT